MGRFDTTKATINANIRNNGNQEITGQVLNGVLTQIVNDTESELTELSVEISGKSFSKSWNYTISGEVYDSIPVDIKKGEKYTIEVGSYTGTLYWYINGVSKGNLAEAGDELVADTNITYFTFFLNQPTSNGVLSIKINSLDDKGLIGNVSDHTESIALLQNDIDIITDNISELSDVINGKTYSQSWSYKSGVDVDPQNAILNVDIKKGSKYVINVEPYTGALYWYINGVSKGGFADVSGELVADTDIKYFSFFLSKPTNNGSLNVEVSVEGNEGLSVKVENIESDLQIISQEQKLLATTTEELTKITKGGEYVFNGSWSYTSSAGLDPSKTILNVDIKKGSKYVINVEPYTGALYWYINGVSKGLVSDIKGELVAETDITSFSFFLHQPTSNGTLNITINATIESQFEQLEERISILESKSTRYRIADALEHWLKGEKFAIGFHGDSTTDGVSTTGWSVDNSHPAQDEAVGGAGARGVVDYVCELAYPKQLQNMLRAELKNDNLKIYNIGYYGASLKNNLSQLSAIYGDVYADVKMVGITLSINDRGGETSETYYTSVKDNLIQYVEFFFAKGITPFMVTQQIVTQIGNNPNKDGGVYDPMYQDYIQILSNKAKEEVAKMYDLEVIDMNGFGRLLMKSSSYPYSQLTEGLHFKDLGHRLEAGFLFSELIPWVNKSDNANRIYWGLACGNSKTDFAISRYYYASHINEFKVEINKQKDSSDNVLIFDSYMFVNSEDGAYNVTYHTPAASGYIIVDNDYNNPISITSTEQNLGVWDIGLHHIQVYTGNSTTIAFRGFILDKVVE